MDYFYILCLKRNLSLWITSYCKKKSVVKSNNSSKNLIPYTQTATSKFTFYDKMKRLYCLEVIFQAIQPFLINNKLSKVYGN